MLDPMTNFGASSSLEDWRSNIVQWLNSTLPQVERQPNDQQPVSSAAAQVLAGSLYRLLEQPHTRYSTYRDLLGAVRDFQDHAGSVATQRTSEGLRRSEYAPRWLAEVHTGVTAFTGNSPATSQFVKLDLGVASPDSRLGYGAATLTIARGTVEATGFNAASTRAIPVGASATLRQLVQLINGANAGVGAALSGKYLLLTGDSPGAGNAFKLDVTGAARQGFSFDPFLYNPATPPAAVLIYHPARDAENAATAVPQGRYTQGHGGTTAAIETLTRAVNTLLDTVSETAGAGVVTLANPLLRDVERAVRSLFDVNASLGSAGLTPWSLGFALGADGLTFDASRHLAQYAADPAGTRSAIDDLAARLAGKMNDSLDGLHAELQSLAEGALLGVAELMRDGRGLAAAVTAYADSLMLGQATVRQGNGWPTRT